MSRRSFGRRKVFLVVSWFKKRGHAIVDRRYVECKELASGLLIASEAKEHLSCRFGA